VAFLAAFNQRIDNRAAIFAAYDEAFAELADTNALDAEARPKSNTISRRFPVRAYGFFGVFGAISRSV